MRIAIALILVAACGGRCGDDRAGTAGSGAAAGAAGSGAPPRAAGEGSAPAPAAGLGKLAVTVSGEPVAMRRALVTRLEPDRYQLYLTSHGGTCRELLDHVFEARDRVDVLANLTPRLGPDGKRHLQVSEVFEGAPTMIVAPGARAQVTGEAAMGEPVELALDFVATAQEPEAKGLSIEVRGTFTAEGCGARAPDPAGVPRAAHPTSATITIAHQRLELKGALVKGRGRARELVLSTTPRDCSPRSPPAAVILERAGGRWRASGTWLERPALAAGKPGLAAALGAAGQSDDGPTVELALSGAGDVGGYPVALDGTIEAIDCGP